MLRQVRGAAAGAVHHDGMGAKMTNKHSNDTNDTRWSSRRRVQLQVEVYCAGRPYARCVTRDVGLGGMFIEAQGTLPRCNRGLELVVRDAGAEGGRRHRFRATVVRRSDEGLGVAFSRYELADVRALQALL